MPITIPNVSVSRSLQGFGQSVTGLGVSIAKAGRRQRNLEIQNESAEMSRRMDAETQTFSQSYFEQRNKQNNIYTTPGGEGLRAGDDTQFTAGDYTYSLPQGSTVTGEGDNISADYGDRLWEKKFAGQFSSQESEDNFRRVYDAKMAAFSGEFRQTNFGYRRQNEAEQIGRELSGIEANPKGLSISQSMESVEATTQKAFDAGLTSNQQRVDQNAKSEYVLLTGETWRESQAVARAAGGDEGYREAWDHIDQKAGLNDDTKKDLKARIESTHRQNMGREDNQLTLWDQNVSNSLESKILSEDISSLDLLNQEMDNTQTFGEYTQDRHSLSDPKRNYLRSFYKSQQEGGAGRGSTKELSDEEIAINNMIYAGAPLEDIEIYMEGLVADGTWGSTDILDKKEELEKRSDEFDNLVQTARNIAESLLKDEVKNNDDFTAADMDQVLADYTTFRVHQQQNISATTVTPEQTRDWIKNRLAGDQVRKIGQVKLDSIGVRLSGPEQWFRFAEEKARIGTFDLPLVKEGLVQNMTGEEFREQYYGNINVENLSDVQKNVMENTVDFVDLIHNSNDNFEENFGSQPDETSIDQDGFIYFTLDRRMYRLDEEDKKLHYDTLDTIEDPARAARVYDKFYAQTGVRGKRVVRGNDGVIYVEGRSNGIWYREFNKGWQRVNNPQDNVWTEYEGEVKQPQREPTLRPDFTSSQGLTPQQAQTIPPNVVLP